MYCKHCGAKLAENELYCGQCGQAIEEQKLAYYCPKCAKVYENKTKYCTHCGVELIVTTKDSVGKPEDVRIRCTKCGVSMSPSTVTCPQCGEYNGRWQPEPVRYSAPSIYDYDMKWYNFLIYFLLFATAVLNVLYGIRYMSNSLNLEYSYSIQSDMRTLNTVFGLVSFGIAIWALVTRHFLANLKKAGPSMFLSLIGVTPLLSSVYDGLTCKIMKVDLSDLMLDPILEMCDRLDVDLVIDKAAFEQSMLTSLLFVLLFYAVYIGLNATYFHKRKELFVN